MSDLPPGFVLDQQAQSAGSALPPGFVLDQSPSIASDVAKSGGIGVAKGLIGLGGLPGDVEGLMRAGVHKLGSALGLPEPPSASASPVWSVPVPGSQDIQSAIESQTGKFYEPKTTAGRYAETAGEFLPAAALPAGQMSMGEKLLKMVAAPAAASEAAGELTEGTAAEPYARAAAAIATPLAGTAVRRAVLAPKPTMVPRYSTNVAGVDVPMSPGQATQNTTTQMMENAALRGARGDPAQQAAEGFFSGQQKPAIEQARSAIAQNLDPFGQTIADTPQEAARIASESLQREAASQRGAYDAAYKQARSYPGEIHAGAFEGMAQKIKGDLSLRPSPIIVSDRLTPYSSEALQYLDNEVSNLKIQNRADPFGQPNPQNIVGVNLNGVDQWRKYLSALRNGATGSGNASDARAMRGILDSFDDRIDQAINGGLFNGSPDAVKAWNNARAAYSDYRGAFTANKNDPIGKVIEKIIGRNAGGPLPSGPAIPNDVVGYLWGATGTNPSTLNVGVATRMKQILGAQSPEWSAVRQGLWSKITQNVEGATDWGPQKVATNLAKLLNGPGGDLAKAMYSPPELSAMQNYLSLQQQMIPKPGTVNYSNSGVLLSALKGAANSLMTFIGAHLAGPVGAVVGKTADMGLAKTKENLAAGALNRSLYRPQPNPSYPWISPDWKQRALINAVLGSRGGTDDQRNRQSLLPAQ